MTAKYSGYVVYDLIMERATELGFYMSHTISYVVVLTHNSRKTPGSVQVISSIMQGKQIGVATFTSSWIIIF